ncbi:MAG: TolC family protein [Scytonematopsis contorta HA4267-MV1]|nr:TolC family protein [Scytonematopsis contorta HA4267-MV1]
MKGQHLFYSFLPGVTAAVLTTQTGLATTVRLSLQTPVVSENGSNTYGQNLAVDVPTDLRWQRKSTIPISKGIAALDSLTELQSQIQSQITSDIKVTVINNTGISLAQVSPSSSNSVNSTLNSTLNNVLRTSRANPNLPPSGDKGNNIYENNNYQKQSELINTLKRQRNVVISTSNSSPAVEQKKTQSAVVNELAGQEKKPVTVLPTLSQISGKVNAAAATLLPGNASCLPNCPQANTQITKQASIREVLFLAQRTPPTPTNPTPTAPAATPANPVPVAPREVQRPPAPAELPNYLNSNPNPLQFPTTPQEVQITGTQPLTLAQVIELARRNNKTLQSSLLVLEANQASLRAAQASLLPTLGISSSLARGGAANIIGDTRPRTDTTNFSAGLELGYTLFTSGSRTAQIRASEERVRRQELEVERQSEEVRLNVTRAYYVLQQADENVRINGSAVENARASLRDAEALERAGVGTRFDVLTSQVNLAQALTRLTQARAQQQTNGRQLASLLSVPQIVNIVAADPVRVAGLWNQTLEQSIVLAFKNRPELQQDLIDRNISEQERRQILAQGGPQIALSGSYNLGDTFDDTRRAADDYRVVVTASLSLYDGGARRANAAAQKANIAAAEVQFSQRRDSIRFEVEQAFFELQSNFQNIQTAEAALVQARDALRLARLRFQAGVGTQTDVIRSENDLTQQEGNRVNAIIQYNTSLAQLQRAVTSRQAR